MGISINQQLMSFLISVMCGAAMGIFFDCFRSIRKMIHMNDIVVNVCDGLFFLISGFFAFFTILTVNNGELVYESLCFFAESVFQNDLLYIKANFDYF